ncbi:MAG: hypothetical protein WKF30_19370, partial [Pyrinomonadaceae bacterium]
LGGLRKYMPYTHLSCLIGWLAIFGVIPFGGFWSKDEILWRAASTSVVPFGWLLWLIAAAASVCTAFYMTRLVALTFWGRERFIGRAGGGQADEAHAHGYDEGLEAHDARTASVGDRPRHEPLDHVGARHPQHGHGMQLPRESPRVMWMPLVVLALLATVGGLVGVGPAFSALTGSAHPGGRLNIVNWLDPIIWNAATGEFGRASEAIEHSVATGGATSFNLAHAAQEILGGSHAATEWAFIFISLLGAALGMGLAYLCYVRRPKQPIMWATRFGPLYRASLNKFWIDDLYGFMLTRRVMDAARAVHALDVQAIDAAINGAARAAQVLSRAVNWFDQRVIDWIVNGLASFVRVAVSPLLRRGQTGFAQNYALVMIVGLVAALALFLRSGYLRDGETQLFVSVFFCLSCLFCDSLC